MKLEFEAGLAAAGRARTAVEVNLWPWVASSGNVHEAIHDARPTMAFHGGIKQYERFFEATVSATSRGVCRRAYNGATT